LKLYINIRVRMSPNIFTPIKDIPRIGPAYLRRLKRLKIKTLHDLLFHFPFRYNDFSKITSISKVRPGQTCCLKGKILDIETIKTWKKRLFITTATLKDKTGTIKATWFNQPYLTNSLKEGNTVYLAGRISFGKGGKYLSNPVYEKLSEKERNLTHTGRLVPVYPETGGLSSRWLRYVIKPLLTDFREEKDPLPESIRKEFNLLPFREALWQIHFPETKALAKKAQDRFSFENLLMIQLIVLRERMKIAEQQGIPIPIDEDRTKELSNSLSFKLTDAQKKCSWQILKDIERKIPMNRLLEGDVGSGKTIVAAFAILNTAKAGFQVAMMTPTEILSKQHFRELAKILADFKLNIGLLTGKTDKFVSKKLKRQVIEISRKKLLEKTIKGEIDILIGTHALIQDKVKFKNLALVILDEQHRFGVKQRAKLINSKKEGSGSIPHLLSMTATPIPRTLALTIYGDLDLSLIDELPKGRKKITTKVINPKNRKEAYDFIESQIKEGRQVFVICPRIEGQSEEGVKKAKASSSIKKKQAVLSWSEVKAVKEEYEKLSKEIFPDLRVGILHGKMTSKEKEKAMLNFKNKKIDILVSTSVVEVGIDIPEATVMMIEGAERFGLAQLHQFRGRVGRSNHQSFCLLFTDSPSRKTNQRLKALINCDDGFALSEKDLEIRGPGNLIGTKQWGIPDLAMEALGNIFLIEKTKRAANDLLVSDPELKKCPLLQKKLGEFQQRIHLE